VQNGKVQDRKAKEQNKDLSTQLVVLERRGKNVRRKGGKAKEDGKDSREKAKEGAQRRYANDQKLSKKKKPA